MDRWVPVLAIVGWVGVFVHNVADLPGQTILNLESFLPLLATATLVTLWFTPSRFVAAWAMLAWAVLNLAGAIVTVLPLTIRPFDPEQSAAHYAFHLLYGLAQVPVIVAAAWWIRRRSRTALESSRDAPPLSGGGTRSRGPGTRRSQDS